MSEPAPLSRNRDFNVFWAGQAISALGDAFAIVAAPLLVLQATGSVASMGRFSAIVACAYVASGLVAGSIVDRVDRRRLMIFCDLGRTAVYLTTPLVWWVWGPSYPVLLATSAIGAFLGNIFQVAAITAVANLVPREQLIEANGRMHGAWAAMFFVGPMLAGEACQRFGAVVGFAADAVSFLLSAFSVTLVRGRFNADTRAGGGGARADFSLGFRFLWREPVLRATAALLAGCALVMGGRENLLVFYVKRGLRGDDRAVGTVFALAAVGAMVAAALASRLRRRFGYAANWLAAGALMGAAVMAVGRAHTVAAVAALACAVGFAETLRGINTMTLRQEVTPEHMLGRVTAVFWTLLTFPAALGAELSGRLAERYGVPATLSGTGAAMLVLIAVGTRTAITQPVPQRAGEPAVAATS